MSFSFAESPKRGGETPPLVFEQARLRDDLQARIATVSDNDTRYAEGAEGVELERKAVSESVLDFWEQYESIINAINQRSASGQSYVNTEDLAQLQDQEFTVAQIAEKLINQHQDLDHNALALLYTKVLLAQMVISPIKVRVLSSHNPMLKFPEATSDGSQVMTPEAVVLDIDPAIDIPPPNRSFESGRAVVTIPGENAVNTTIETLISLPPAEREAFEFLVAKFNSQILPDMQSLVGQLGDSDLYNPYIDKFNATAKEIYELEDEIANPELLAPISEYQVMGQNLRELVNKAGAQYFALLQAYEDETEKGLDRSTQDTAEPTVEVSLDPDLEAADVVIEKAYSQLKAVRSVLENAQSVRLDSRQLRKMGTIQDLLGDPLNHKSIASSQESLKKAATLGEDTAGSRELLRNKVEALQQNLAEIGQALALFMTEDDRQLFTDDIAPVAASSLGTSAVDAATVALSSVPAEVVTDVKTAPASTEKIGQSERISEELFALYKAASHDAIWPPADRSAAMPEKRITQITNEINAAMAKQGYTREATTAFFKDTLHGIISRILVVYRGEKNGEVRAQKLYDLFDELLQNIAAKLNTTPEVSPAVAATPSVPAETLPQAGPDLPKESDQAVAVESTTTVESSGASGASAGIIGSEPAVPEAVLEQKDTMLRVLEADLLRLKKVRDRVLNEAGSASEDNKPLVSFSLKLINKKIVAALNQYKSFKTIPAGDLEIGKIFLTVSRSIQEQLTIVNDVVTRLRSEVSGSNANTVSEILDINLDEEWVVEDSLDIDLNKLEQEAMHTSNEATPEQTSVVDLDLSDEPNNTDKSPNNFAEATGIFTSNPDIYPPEVNTKLLPAIRQYLDQFDALVSKGLDSKIADKIRSLFFGDNSVESLLWQVKSDFEDGKGTYKLCDEIERKMVDIDVLIMTNLYLLDLGSDGVNLEATGKEDDLADVTGKENLFSGVDNPENEVARQADLQRELADMKEQVERLRSYVSSQGAEASPEVLRVLEMIESAENAPELDQKVSSMNLDRRLRAIKKILKGEDKRSGSYFTALSAEERLAMAGLPTTLEDSAARALEDGDAYTEALDAYRAARLRFMGGTRRVGAGIDETPDGATRRVEVASVKAYYEFKLHDFYKEAGTGRLNRIKNAFGFKPKLTPELEVLRKEYTDARLEYARTLQAVMAMRSGRFDTNKSFDVTTKETKKAFGEKFVLEEFRQQQKIQMEALEQPKNETIQKILGVMRKHKWAMRGVTVVGAGVIAGGGLAALGIGAAALSGTAAVIGSATAAARMTASIGLGAWLGKAAHFKYQGKVDTAQKAFADSEAKATESFSVDQLNELESSLFATTEATASAVRQQKIKTVAAAALPGGLVGIASAVDAISGVSAAEIGEVHEAALAQSVEIEPANPSQPTMILEKVDFIGKGLNKGVVPEADWLQMRGIATQKALDELASRPNVPEAELERLVMQKLEANFGTKSWWNDVNLDSIDLTISKRAPIIPQAAEVGTEAVSVQPSGVATEAGRMDVDSAPVPPLPQPETVSALTKYPVQEGDSLSKIALEKFKTSVIHDLSPAEQKAAIYELMKRAETNASLRETIGLRGTDINKIYTGQTINLVGLEKELQTIVSEESYRAPEVSVKPGTGGLTVSNLDANVNTVPIQVAARPEDFVAETSLPPAESPRLSAVEASPTAGRPVSVEFKANPLEAPRPYSLSGNYLDTREYRNFVTEVFGSVEKFNRAVTAEVTKFERGTYDALDRLMGTDVYQSPYKEFANLTMAEIDAKRAELEYMKQQYDTFGSQVAKNPFGEVGQMKYETYRASVERLEQLKREYAWTPNTKLSDLVGRVVAETKAQEMAEANTLLKA